MRIDAIYTRQSVNKLDSLSIETQIEKCEAITDKGAKIYSDKGYSGKNIQRPALEQLLIDIKANKIKRVIVYRLDRISRNIVDFYNLQDLLQEHNVTFISVNESFDTSTSLGRVIMGILVVFAQMERESIQERVKDNYYARISYDGRWCGGPAPYGFKNARTNDNAPTLIINKEEMEVVKYCFEKYAYSPNISLQKLCNQLKELGYKSRRENGAWDSVTIARMLQNTVYVQADEILKKFLQIRKIKFLNNCEWDGSTSCHIVGKRKNNCNIRAYTTLEEQSVYLTNFKGTIDSKTFIIIQERLAQNEQIKNANKVGRLKELGGLLKCNHCGYAIKSYSKSTNGTPYLSCYGNLGLKSCDATFRGIKFTEIQNAVANEIQKELDQIYTQINDEINSNLQKENQIKELQQQINNLIQLVALGGETANVVHKQIEALQRQINEIQLNDLMNIQTNEKLKMANDSPIIYKDLSDEEKKNLCQQLIEKIYLSSNGDLEIVWKI